MRLSVFQPCRLLSMDRRILNFFIECDEQTNSLNSLANASVRLSPCQGFQPSPVTHHRAPPTVVIASTLDLPSKHNHRIQLVPKKQSALGETPTLQINNEVLCAPKLEIQSPPTPKHDLSGTLPVRRCHHRRHRMLPHRSSLGILYTLSRDTISF